MGKSPSSDRIHIAVKVRAGCDSDDILTHCRGANPDHVRGCWVVDLVLGKG
jgi:hypothetical protein